MNLSAFSLFSAVVSFIDRISPIFSKLPFRKRIPGTPDCRQKSKLFFPLNSSDSVDYYLDPFLFFGEFARTAINPRTRTRPCRILLLALDLLAAAENMGGTQGIYSLVKGLHSMGYCR